MKLFLLILALATFAWAKPAGHYTDKFDHINVDEILESQRLLKSYLDCLMDRGRCTVDAKELKATLPDALENDCSKCTPKQKESSDKVIRHLVNKQPAMWDELSTKYDPNNIYSKRYKDRVESIKTTN